MATTIAPTTTITPLYRGVTISHKSPVRETSESLVPYVIFSVNPGLGDCYEFMDMFINASHKPDSVIFSLDKNFTDYATVITSKIKEYNTGWYNISRLPKTIGNKVLIGKILFVKIIFPDDNNNFYTLKFVKTGYRNIMGG